jgi:hypothetical protein
MQGKLGAYHLNAVDTVRQWQVVGCVTTICERDLPVLEAMLHQFPHSGLSLRQRIGVSESEGGAVLGMETLDAPFMVTSFRQLVRNVRVGLLFCLSAGC